MEAAVHDAVLDMQIARDELNAALGRISAEDWRRYVPYGSRTLHELLAHIATADHAWAVAAQGLLKGESEVRAAPDRRDARERGIARGRQQPVERLREEMDARRRLLLSLLELLEPRHLALALPAYGQRHNSVRERIWLGYHDRLHAADIDRALRMRWQPPKPRYAPELQDIVPLFSTDGVRYVVYNVDPVMWERPSSVPGWTFRQLLAHIASGDWVLQGHLRHIIETGRVGPWPDIAEGNARLLAEREHTIVGKLTEEYLSMRQETLGLLAKLKPSHLALPIELWWKPEAGAATVLDYLREFPGHDAQHVEQLRPAMKFLRAQVERDGHAPLRT